VLDAVSQLELGRRWSYRAGLEASAAVRFDRLADRMIAASAAPDLIAIAREASQQEHTHVRLCADLAARFGVDAAVPMATAPEVAPPSWSVHDRLLYEVVAFCCVAETANAAVVMTGEAEVDDRAVRRAVHTILADEVQHSRLGWRFLATHPIDDRQRGWLGHYLPVMMAGTVRTQLFATQTIVGDEAAMARLGTAPIAARRGAFLDGMRAVVLPGMASWGVDVGAAAEFLNRLEHGAGTLHTDGRVPG
jgi:hypothetical protein